MAKRIAPEARQEEILAAALDLAAASHFQTVTRDAVAEAAECSPGLVSRYFQTMDGLRDAIVAAAVERRVLRVVAQGLVAQHAAVADIQPWLRDKALASAAASS